jgi:hypothetical protein
VIRFFRDGELIGEVFWSVPAGVSIEQAPALLDGQDADFAQIVHQGLSIIVWEGPWARSETEGQ